MGREKAAVEGLIGEGWFELTEWRMHNFLLSAEGVITARGARYPVRLSYPDQFPHVPAWVEPLDEKMRWSAHQHGEGGSLCLERRPDNWHPDVTGADLLKSAFYLLDVENPEGEGEKGEVASGHNVGPLQSYDWAGQPVLLGYGFLGRLLTDSAEGVASLRWGTRDGVTPVLIFDSVDRSRRGGIPGGELGSLRLARPVIVAKAYGPENTPATRAELAEVLGCDLTIPSYEGPVLVVAVTPRSLTIYDLPDQTTVRERRWIPLPDDEGLRSGRSPESAGKRVAIVGLGSVGSKIAEILVRSGVHNIVLIDGDVVFWKAGTWVERFADADLFDDTEAAEAAEGKAKSQPTVVIDPYLIDVVIEED
ncbi:MAG: hypothetical protein B7Z52_00190, partial [Burkholderiales bacterium 12-64-5]